MKELREILSLSAATPAAHRILIDLSLARGLSYYTGAIFEIRVPELAGSLGGGGRYDNLIGMFLNDEVPACGISLGLERILVVMTDREMFEGKLDANPPHVMVTVWNAAQIGQSLKLASQLREPWQARDDLRVETYPEADKLGKQFKYASSRGIPFVAIIGDEELANGTVALKNMTTGEQVSVDRESIVERIHELLRASKRRTVKSG